MAKKNPSMGGLEMPTGMDVNQELGRQLIGDSFGKDSSRITNQVNMLANSSFASASSKYSGIEKIDNLANAKAKAKHEEDVDFMKSIAKKPVAVRKTIDNKPGPKVKIGSRYIPLGKFIAVCLIIVGVLASFALFVPPIFLTNIGDSYVGDRNIFATKSINELRVEYADKYSMEDNNALKSERAENYREVFVKFDAINMSVFQTRVPQFKLLASQSKSPDRIVYVGAENPHATMQPFSKTEITVKVLINVEDMTDSDFRDLLQGMVFCTVDMDRKVSKTVSCPCIPAAIFVSDDLVLTIN
ncbi:MAG: hypothetical protein K6F91_04415 [Ruminococcus sp.]|nr:hypothetical protein [Ruminococcus sp.]